MTEDKQLKNLILINFGSLLLVCLIIAFNPQFTRITMILQSVLHLQWTSIAFLTCGLLFFITFIILLLALKEIITSTLRSIKGRFDISSNYRSRFEISLEYSLMLQMALIAYVTFVSIMLLIMWRILLALAIILAVIFALLHK